MRSATTAQNRRCPCRPTSPSATTSFTTTAGTASGMTATTLGRSSKGNRVEDHPGSGIFYEISGRGVIRNNVVRRSGEHGVFISTSKDVEIYNNRFEDNFRGIQYFVDCGSVGGGAIGWDLANDIARDNLVSVGAATGSLASGLSLTSNCAPAQVAAYVNGSKRLQFADNRYSVPSTIGSYWLWGVSLKPFSDWQVLGLDRQGSVSQESDKPRTLGHVELFFPNQVDVVAQAGERSQSVVSQRQGGCGKFFSTLIQAPVPPEQTEFGQLQIAAQCLHLAFHPKALVNVVEEIVLKRVDVGAAEEHAGSAQQRDGVVALHDQVPAWFQDAHASVEELAGIEIVDRAKATDRIDGGQFERRRGVVFAQVCFGKFHPEGLKHVAELLRGELLVELGRGERVDRGHLHAEPGKDGGNGRIATAEVDEPSVRDIRQLHVQQVLVDDLWRIGPQRPRKLFPDIENQRTNSLNIHLSITRSNWSRDQSAFQRTLLRSMAQPLYLLNVVVDNRVPSQTRLDEANRSFRILVGLAQDR